MEFLRYGFFKELRHVTFDEALSLVVRALRSEGFGVLSEIDVKQTLKNKLDVDFRRYTILGACNPALAHQALEKEEHIGLLLPCNVVVQEASERGVIVSIADPRELFTLVDNPAPSLAQVSEDAARRLRRVLASLA